MAMESALKDRKPGPKNAGCARDAAGASSDVGDSTLRTRQSGVPV